jgi:hypothetical protein
MSAVTGPPGDTSRRVAVRVIVGLLAVHGLIAVVNLSPLIESYTVSRVLDVNAEATFVVWLTSATLLAIAAGAAWIAAGEASRRARIGWSLVAAGFVVLSMDETAGIHELVGELANRFLEISWLPSLYLWVVVVAPFAAVGAAWLARWFALELGWRSFPGRLALIAIGLWVTVPGYEALDVPLGGARWLVVLEETVEGIGGALMLGAVVCEATRRRWVTRHGNPVPEPDAVPAFLA